MSKTRHFTSTNGYQILLD